MEQEKMKTIDWIILSISGFFFIGSIMEIYLQIIVGVTTKTNIFVGLLVNIIWFFITGKILHNKIKKYQRTKLIK